MENAALQSDDQRSQSEEPEQESRDEESENEDDKEKEVGQEEGAESCLMSYVFRGSIFS